MGAESSTLELCTSLRSHRERMEELCQIAQDMPYEHSVARCVLDDAEDQIGWLTEIIPAALQAHQQLQAGNYQQVVEALAEGAELMDHLVTMYFTRLKSLERLDDLQNLGLEHPEDWSGWVMSIEATLDQCDPLAILRSLSSCWRDLAIQGIGSSSRFVYESRPASGMQ